MMPATSTHILTGPRSRTWKVMKIRKTPKTTRAEAVKIVSENAAANSIAIITIRDDGNDTDDHVPDDAFPALVMESVEQLKAAADDSEHIENR